MSTIQNNVFLSAIKGHDADSTAIVHSESGESFSYGTLLQDVVSAKQQLLEQTGRQEQGISEQRIAFLVENSYDYVVTLLSILAASAIAVPLSPSFPTSELQYIIDHSESLALLSSSKHAAQAQKVLDGSGFQGVVHAQIKQERDGSRKSVVELIGSEVEAKGGMMLYTSGTTARPKGVLLSQHNLAAQAQSLVTAWQYSKQDHLLHVLPLHHIHGTINALLTPLLAGSSVEFAFPFDVNRVWARFAAPFAPDADRAMQTQRPITFFTAVPTIWARMLQAFPQLDTSTQELAKKAVSRQNLRLNISGSAALPKPTRDAWTELSGGNVLLERYGMTEVGMALSCGLDDADRVDGSVGWPLPGVEARLVDTETNEVIPVGEETNKESRSHQGEIQLRGATIFQEYWQNEEATKKEFTQDGWFKTGDIAERRPVEGAGEGKSGDWATGPAYFIQGRKSADIIKTGGEKVSALEVERELLALPEVEECAVVALPSDTWGQKVAAVIVLSEQGKTSGRRGKPWSALDMRRALKDRLAAYKIPQDMKVVDSIPRNAMGKVNKKQLVPAVFGEPEDVRRRSIEQQSSKKS